MKTTYTVILDWMLDKGLTASELLCYATIYGFCQDGESSFNGSRAYLGRKMAVSSNRTVDAALQSLSEKGLIRKTENTFNGVKFCSYSIVQEAAGEERGIIIPAPGTVTQAPSRSTAFDFRGRLIGLGVDAQLADDWLKVRKAKKMVNTEVAFAAVEREIAKAGCPANDCVRLAVEKSWGGFKAEWMANEFARESYGPSRPVSAPAPRRSGVSGSEEIVAAAMAEFNK